MHEFMVYLSGRYLPRSQARLDIEDRGTLFGDGVYEVVRYYAGRPLAMDAHVARLRRSCAGIGLRLPDAEAMAGISDELVRRNKLRDARSYWQITRGAHPRHHDAPPDLEPTVLLIVTPEAPIDPDAQPRELAAVTAPDERWHHPWIKSLMLLPNVLARQRAQQADADDAILHRDGIVTEATTTCVIIVRDGQLLARPNDQWILASVTRQIVLDLAGKLGIGVLEQPFDLDMLRNADEIALLGTTTHVAAVTRLDGQPVGGGSPGPITRKLLRALVSRAMGQ